MEGGDFQRAVGNNKNTYIHAYGQREWARREATLTSSTTTATTTSTAAAWEKKRPRPAAAVVHGVIPFLSLSLS